MIIVHGCPRSGTTWLAKIFDSHPDVLYRHEPDIERRSATLPFLLPADGFDSYIEEAREYVTDITRVRGLRTSGSLPIFPKSYHSRFEGTIRKGFVSTLRVLEAVFGGKSWVRRLSIPDFLDPNTNPAVRTVIKSVSSMGRTQLFMRALPKAKFVVIVRHPCGYASSVLRGRQLRKMPADVPTRGLAETVQGRRRGLTEEMLAVAEPAEKLAWVWTLLNEAALEGDTDPNHIKVLRYEDLCEAPIERSRELFDFCGLSWNSQTERFLGQSTSGEQDARYFSVVRDTAAAANRWRTEMLPEDIATIERIVKGSVPGRLFYPD
jgi:hypothetical protein